MVPANFWPTSGGNPSSGVKFMVAFEWGKPHQQSREFGTLSGRNPYIIVGTLSQDKTYNGGF